MTDQPHPHSALTVGLDCMKAAGLITRYNLVWESGSEAPKILLWTTTDTPNEALRRSIADGLAGLAGESQLSIERD